MSILNRIFGRSDAKSKDVSLLNFSVSDVKDWLGGGNYFKEYERSLDVFSCVSMRADHVSSMDLRLFKIINSKGDVDEQFDHPLIELVEKWNPWQTRTQGLKIAEINKALTGEAYILKVRNERGEVSELWNLRPDCITVHKDPVLFIKGYEYNKGDGNIVMFAPEDIIANVDIDPSDGIRGISPLKPAKVIVETEQYATRYQRDFFKNNARPDFLLQTDESMGKEEVEDLWEMWDKRHKGEGKSSRPGVMHSGLKFQQVSLSQSDMKYFETLNFTRDSIARAFGVPKPLLTSDDVNRANHDGAMYQFLSGKVKSEDKAFVEAFNEHLTQEFGEEFYFDFKDPTPEDREFRLKEHETYIKAGVLSINEVREELNREPFKGADEPLVPFSNMPISALGGEKMVLRSIKNPIRGKGKLYRKLLLAEKFTALKAKRKAVENGKARAKNIVIEEKEIKPTSLLMGTQLRETYVKMSNRLIDSRARSMKEPLLKEIKKQQKRVIDALKENEKSLKTKLLPSEVARLLNRDAENTIMTAFALPFLTDFLKEAGKEGLETVGVARDFLVTSETMKYLEKRAAFFAESVNNTTLEKLSNTLAEGIEAGEGIKDLTDRVKATYGEFSDYRAELIARTEATAATNEGILEGYQQSGVVKGKEWVATQDDRTRDEHLALDGEGSDGTVPLDGVFSNGLHEPSEPNCRCRIIAVV
jgi:HK97 family phage portal protein